MDEPLSNLDAKLRLEMRMEIRRLHQTLGLTTVYVTHDQEEALSLADRLVVLRDGTVQQIGTPEEVYAQPVNSYVASFMGYRNLLDVTITGTTGSSVTVEGAGVRLTGRGSLTEGPAKVAIRPEDFVVGDSAANALDVTVEIVEYHGRELSISARLASGVPVYFRTDKRLAPGDTAQIGVPAERVLVFEP
jgi:putative spermidine/putrescine transport system ATP-binding protein